MKTRPLRDKFLDRDLFDAQYNASRRHVFLFGNCTSAVKPSNSPENTVCSVCGLFDLQGASSRFILTIVERPAGAGLDQNLILSVLSRKWINTSWDVDRSVNFVIKLVLSNLAAKTLIPSLTSLSTCRGASGALHQPKDHDCEYMHFFLQKQMAMSITNENHHLRSHLFLPSRSTAIIRFPRRDIAFLVLLF